ncbi:MAG: GatB/YqeY domain-containing protein [Gammaproteobacteria bacterium]
MSLKQTITDDMKAAMRSGDVKKRDTIRLLLAAVKQREVDERIELDDSAVVAVIVKMMKQRKDSIEQYESAQRDDLAAVEKEEISVLTAYIPEALTDAEIEFLIQKVITETGATGQKDMGKVMAVLKPKIAGRADMGKVSGLVKEKIQA